MKRILREIGFGAIYRDQHNVVRTTHKQLKPMVELLRSMPDYDDHDMIALQYNERANTVFSAFVHRTYRGQAQGGLRLSEYPTMKDLLFDGIRLSTGMSRKNALAGLWWGGGKGIILKPDQTYDREKLFNDYGTFISKLRGSYVTAEDVGTTPVDMKNILKETRFVTCIPEDSGGSGNPSEMTATGVVVAIGQILDKPYDETRVAIQGAGNVSQHIVKQLAERGIGEIHISDLEPNKLTKVREIFSQHSVNKNAMIVTIVNGDVLRRDVDILIPCAMGGCLNDDSIPNIRAKYVVGAANNQLEKSRNDLDLKLRGIVYVPDFVVNRMGIVNCCNEQFGSLKNDPMKASHYDPSHPSSIP